MKLNPILTVLLITIMLLLSACRESARPQAPANPNVNIEATVSPTPHQVGPATLTIIVNDAADQPLAVEKINIRADMTHAGMVPVLAESTTANDDGSFTIPFEWTMGGDWYIVVDVQLADGESASATFDFVVAS